MMNEPASAGAAAPSPAATTAPADYAQFFLGVNSSSLQLFAHCSIYSWDLSENMSICIKKTHHLEGWNTCPSRGNRGCCQVFFCGSRCCSTRGDDSQRLKWKLPVNCRENVCGITSFKQQPGQRHHFSTNPRRRTKNEDSASPSQESETERQEN